MAGLETRESGLFDLLSGERQKSMVIILSLSLTAFSLSQLDSFTQVIFFCKSLFVVRFTGLVILKI